MLVFCSRPIFDTIPPPHYTDVISHPAHASIKSTLISSDFQCLLPVISVELHFTWIVYNVKTTASLMLRDA